MNRKLISAFLALILCLSLAVCVSAAPDTGFVVDEIGYLTDSEIDSLNEHAADIYDSCGVGIFFIFTTADSLEAYPVETLVGSLENYFVMIENETNWFTFCGGSGNSIDDAAEAELRAVYDEAETYIDGVKDFLYAAKECFPESTDTTQTAPPAAGEYFVFDEANLLTDREEADLVELLTTVSHDNNAQIIVATISSLAGGDVDGYLNYLYDSMGFGYGTNHDGVLLLVCMDPREYRILSNGYAGVAIDPSDIDNIGEKIVSDLSDGDYASAFRKFAEQCDYYLDGYTNGFPFTFGKNLLICLVIGAVAGLIVALVLKGQLKSVRKQNQANVYVKQGSMQVTVHNDLFLYRDVQKTKKESSSSGSRSGGGTARSTGGGSF